MSWGSTGEFHKLTESERRRVAEVFIEERGRPVPDRRRDLPRRDGACIELSQAAEAAGATAPSWSRRCWASRGDGAIMAHDRAVAAAVAVPIVVQDEPVTTGVMTWSP